MLSARGLVVGKDEDDKLRTEFREGDLKFSQERYKVLHSVIAPNMRNSGYSVVGFVVSGLGSVFNLLFDCVGRATGSQS